MHRRRSELQQAVAPLFSTERSERQKRAIPVLQAARALLVKGWCDGALARDRGGHPVQLTCDKRVAVSWSLYGAPKFVGRADPLAVQFALAELRRAAHPRTLEEANRFSSQREAVALVDKALDACGFERRGGWSISRPDGVKSAPEARAVAPLAQPARLAGGQGQPAATPPGARRLAS